MLFLLSRSLHAITLVSSNWPAGAAKAHAKLLTESRGEMAEWLKAAVC